MSRGRVAHAYLFSGPRGTGKTSTARILAKALNCHAPVHGEPCCECASCVSIAEGRSFDVVELDAASNSGVDAIRSLVAQAPTGTLGKWKVYIIDEVHMLTAGASNALLKTLEEPPGHVVFVLATTDPQKVIATIKSRTQHYEFHFLDEATLQELIESIRTRAELDLDVDAQKWLVSKGGGSARDTLSYLDQIVALGYVPDSKADLDHIIGGIGSKDVKAVIAALDASFRSGQDPQRVCADLISGYRSQFLAEVGGSSSSSSSWLLRALSVLSESLTEMKDSLDPRIILEVAVVRLINPEFDPLIGELSRRISALEQEMSQIKARDPSPVPHGRPQDTPAPSVTESSAPPPTRSTAAQNDQAKARRQIAAASTQSSSRSRDDMAKLRSVVSGAVSGASAQTGSIEKEEKRTQPGASRAEQVGEASAQLGLAGNSMKQIPSDVEEGNRVFKKEILPLLSPKARSLFAAARVVSIEQSRAVLSVPNEAHKSHALANLADVVKAFSQYFSRSDLSVELTSDERVAGVFVSETIEPEAGPDLMDQFSSAPEVDGGGIETQILDIFPGSKKIDS